MPGSSSSRGGRRAILCWPSSPPSTLSSKGGKIKPRPQRSRREDDKRVLEAGCKHGEAAVGSGRAVGGQRKVCEVLPPARAKHRGKRPRHGEHAHVRRGGSQRAGGGKTPPRAHPRGSAAARQQSRSNRRTGSSSGRGGRRRRRRRQRR